MEERGRREWKREGEGNGTGREKGVEEGGRRELKREGEGNGRGREKGMEEGGRREWKREGGKGREGGREGEQNDGIEAWREGTDEGKEGGNSIVKTVRTISRRCDDRDSTPASCPIPSEVPTAAFLQLSQHVLERLLVHLICAKITSAALRDRREQHGQFWRILVCSP
eukprot:6085134-Pleurochrysis_carterae.AAC.3